MLIVSWFIATNHCALGLMPGGTAEHSHCAGCKPPKRAPAGAVLECCKTIQAALASVTDVPAQAIPTWLAPMQWPAAPDAGCCEDARASRLLDHGPPGRPFTELVLQRGLRSHAPPLAA